MNKKIIPIIILLIIISGIGIVLIKSGEYNTSRALLNGNVYGLSDISLNGQPKVYTFEKGQYFEQGSLGELDVVDLKISSVDKIKGENETRYIVWFQERTGGTAVNNYITVATYNKENERFDAPKTVYLGDRIDNVESTFLEGEIVVSYLTRGEDEPFSVLPTVPVTQSFPFSDFE